MTATHPGVTELVRATRAGEVPVTQVVSACLQRIHATDDTLRAWSLLDPAGALEQAHRLDALPAAARGPLFGLPVGVKDVIDVAGLPTGAGFAPYTDRPAPRDAAVVAALRAAGAVIVGKTVTVQFAWADDPPETVNPWDATRTPGGSSSGSAVAVAAGHVPVALGTQTGGSLLRPAAYCAAVGFKPGYGAWSSHGVLPTSWSFDHVGLITRSVTDARTVQAVLAPAGGHPPPPPDEGYRPRLAVVTDLLGRADPSVQAAVSTAADTLARSGARLTELRLPAPLELFLAVFTVMSCAEAAEVHREELVRTPEALRPAARASTEAGLLLPAAVFVHARRLRQRLRAHVDALLDGVDALLCPTVAAPPPPRTTIGPFDLQTAWSLCGLPSLAIPVPGRTPTAPPPSLQLIGARGRDGDLLYLGEWVQRRCGPADLPSSSPHE